MSTHESGAFVNTGMDRARRSGFTLVELLVVIGIIALLIAILLPALNKARKQANAVGCLANTRQLGQSTVMYNNDNGGYFPGCYAGDGNGNRIVVWAPRLRKYMKGNQKVFRCLARDPDAFEWPAGRTGYPQAGANETGYQYYPGEQMLVRNVGTFSYGYNDWGAGQTPAASGSGAITMDDPVAGTHQRGLGGDVDNPKSREMRAARIKMAWNLVELCDRNTDATASDYRYNVDPRDPNEAPVGVHPNNTCNVLWCDGHASMEPVIDLLLFNPKNINQKYPPPATLGGYSVSPIWNKVAPRWNNDGLP